MFFSRFNTRPVVEQKLSFAQQNLCFVLNLSKIAKKAAKRLKRINKKDSAEEAILNRRIKCIRLTKHLEQINLFFRHCRWQ
jgi:hypothetical protein